ncbi:MAG: Rne/Rng family ribonuclease [Candidatus Omnitrophica bacterium]|nr:Rne/Rng family ribonuclease [Candidatus Omnitrophota bacterium]
MSKEILINIEPQEKRVAIVKDGRLEEFYIERPQDKTIVGNIYKGKIEAVVPSVGAAFVDIGLVKKGFLYLSEIEYAFEASDAGELKKKEIKKGDEVLVQVVKESFGTKGPRLTCHIGLAGRYLVLMPQEGQVGISRRIEDDDERKRLRVILGELKIPKDLGFIVRTAACGKSKQELIRDANFLMKLWSRIEKIVQNSKAPALVYEEYDLTFRVIRDSFADDVNKLIVDSKPEFYRILKFMRTFLNYLTKKVEFYRGTDLFEEKDVEKQINKIFESRVYFKSKAYIIIEPTEGLVVIDVNSGGFAKKMNQEETAFKVNCEAAVEVARQLRLRDLGGIIVVDFIDMEREGHRREVLNVLKKALSTDRAKYDILGISKFGLVEITRERIHNTVQTLSYQNCPYCKGRGRVKSGLTTSIYALKELKRFLIKNKGVRQADLSLNPDVVDEIFREKENLKLIENKFKVKINLVSNPALHIEDIRIS